MVAGPEMRVQGIHGLALVALKGVVASASCCTAVGSITEPAHLPDLLDAQLRVAATVAAAAPGRNSMCTVYGSVNVEPAVPPRA